ncbi:MAG: carbohydrate ABC transporter permease [Firmicutes bacterium]|nr:carbohydrate ABC transporter permease [Bacillota bacterium]
MTKAIRLVRYSIILLLAAILALAFALPIFVTFTNSFMTGYEISHRYSIDILPSNYFYRLDVFQQIHFVRMTVMPNWVTFRQYINLLQNSEYLNGLWNSIIITAPSVVGQLIIAVPAAYAFELSKLRHKEKLFFVYIVVMLMPLPVVLVPQFIMAGYLNISESMWAIILPAIFSPFGVFLLRQFMKNISLEFIEAAKIDGAGHLRILLSIVTPLMKPAIAALALLVFIDYWNVVDQAIVFITDPSFEPLSVALTTRFRGMYDIMFAASFFYMIPALLVFLFGQEQLIAGMRVSGLK